MGKQQKTPAPSHVSMYAYSSDLYNKLDKHQHTYAKNIRTHSVTFVDAASGTGKTTIALLVGMGLLAKGEISKIVYLRFPDDRYLKQGFLPGDPKQKEAKLFGPLFDATAELDIGDRQIAEMQTNGLLELSTDMALRGTNMKSVYLILDEAQNAKTIDDLHLVLTRLHDSSKGVVIGHSKQQDNRRTESFRGMTPFQAYASHMTKQPWAIRCDLVTNYRGEISRWADAIWEEGP